MPLLRMLLLEDRLTPNGGASDVTFNGNGYNILTGYTPGTFNDVAVDTANRTIAVGQYNGDMIVAKFLADGTLDTLFANNGILTIDFAGKQDSASGVVLRDDGGFWVSGYVTAANNVAELALLDISSTGVIRQQVLRDIGNDNLSDAGSKLAVNPGTGDLYVAATSTRIVSGSTYRDNAVVRFSNTGAYLGEWRSSANNVGAGHDVAVDPGTGMIYLAGQVPSAFSLVRLNADLTQPKYANVTLNPNIYTGANAVVFDPNNNQLYYVGTSEDGHTIVRTDADMNVTGKRTFLTGTNDGLDDLAVDASGHLVAAGFSTNTNSVSGPFNVVLARLNPDLSLDITFGTNGAKTYNLGGNDVGHGVAFAPDGRIVVAGSGVGVAPNNKPFAARFLAGDTLPPNTPATFTVTNSLDNGSTGSLRWAINQANGTPGADTISFSESLNGSIITLGGTRLEVRNPVSIIGPSQGITIDANLQSQVLYFDGRTNGSYSASLRNLTVTRGKTGDSEEIIDTFNSGDFGGAIVNDQTSLTLNNVTVSNNQSNNSAGGLYNWQGVNSKLTLNNSLFVDNSASVNGGAIYNWTFATINAVNTTFSANTAGSFGGSLFQNGGAITLTNVTATLNVADSDNNSTGTGGFVHISSGNVTLDNGIVSGNLHGPSTSDEIAGTLLATSSNNIVFDTATAGGLTNGTNGNQVGVNPLLNALLDNGGRTRTHALQQNSPALGKGSASVAGYSVYDQRGAARDNGTPDIGAYEVNHPLATVGAPTTLAGLFQPKPSTSANEAFVKGLYQSTLLRAPDTAGLNGWLALLNSGTSRSTVANGFVNSTENRRAQVTFFYRYFLSREPDTAGLNGWVSQLQGGTDEGTVMSGFILSNEFSGLNINSQFVNLMYYALLSRQADSAGFNGWVNALNGGMSRGTVVNAFLRSEEGLNRVIDGLFQVYLKRYGSMGDLGAFRSYLATNTFGQAATLMLSSAEFFTNAGNNLS